MDILSKGIEIIKNENKQEKKRKKEPPFETVS